MTRINTNVSSLVAQNTLGRSNASLNEALTRLSTGLRINTGKDDPAGLIASENLRSDITAIRRAISNTDRANQVIATADSALGQVSSLLNDIRGLVTESANSGALSEEQISANQLQLDSSLEALNRIAQTTTFQGRRLLDGSLDFVTSAGSNFSKLSGLQIDQANLGATGQVAVDITVTTAATQAQVDIAGIPGSITAVNSAGTITFADAAVGSTGTVDIAITAQQSTGTFTAGTTTTVGFDLTAVVGQAAEGATGGAAGGVDLILVDNDDDSGNIATVVYNSGLNTLTVTGDFDGSAGGNAGATGTKVADAIDAEGTFLTSNRSAGVGNNLVVADATTYSNVATGGRGASTETITITGTAGAASNVSIQVLEATGIGATPTVTGDATNGYIVRVDDTVTTNITDIRAAIQGIAEVATATYGGGATYIAGGSDTSLTGAGVTEVLAGGTDAGNDVITITADTDGPANDRLLVFDDSANLGDGVVNVTDNGTTITVAVDDTSTYNLATLAATISSSLTGYSAQLTGSAGNGSFTGGDSSAAANVTGGVLGSGGISADVVLELAGSTGAEVLSFGAGTSIDQLVKGINLVSDATGVTATANGTTLELLSATYGSSSVVDLNVISEGTGDPNAGTFTSAVGQGSRVVGADVVASINGVQATGSGNQLSINTATLDLTATVDANFTGTASFTITGGGALFQLGPDVVSNQQARLGIGSVNTAQLGGVSGKIFQLGTGGSAELSSSNLDVAAEIVEEAITQVTSLRGRLGAFQRTTLETNKNALNDTLVNLTDAESSIRDADFAAESAALTRAQILVQSGTTVLQIANSNPQNVLALLR
ncbi:MAG: hypothetical protein KDA57_13615 [Planctomycetales bacterium]|nr:hypothetical protein [Planctomycetales bacterium]